MNLELQEISKSVAGECHIYPSNLKLIAGSINVLLGPTQAGKTSLLRLMAGLDVPTSGKILVDGKDVTGVSVKKRNLAMVYQQFINYPSLSVFENIAAPLRIKGLAKVQIKQDVEAMAEKLHIAHLLHRLPGELSGGQQQRTALARALIKQAPLILLDEPLVNLDYKLREELREELASLFVDGSTTVVYATTEPQEALLLGGHTAVMDAGRILQFGPALTSYNAPATCRAAAIFNDPPMNMLAATALGPQELMLADETRLQFPTRTVQLVSGESYTIGVRCHQLRLTPPPNSGAVALACEVELAELGGSETYLHLHHGSQSMVAQISGIHQFAMRSAQAVYLQNQDVFIYDAQGNLLSATQEAA